MDLPGLTKTPPPDAEVRPNEVKSRSINRLAAYFASKNGTLSDKAISTARAARQVVRRWLRANFDGMHFELGLPEVDDRYEAWRVALLSSLGGAVGEIMIRCRDGEIVQATRPALIRARLSNGERAGETSQDKPPREFTHTADRHPLQYKPVPLTEYFLVYRKATEKLIDWNIRAHPDQEAVKASRIDDGYEITNLWHAKPAHHSGHPAVFPVELIEKLVRYYSFKNDLVLDPFAGIGTVGKAALRTGRRFYLIDSEPKYCEIAIRELYDESATSQPLSGFESQPTEKIAWTKTLPDSVFALPI